jgi:hypothetical protein
LPGFDSQSLRHNLPFHAISHQKTLENIGFLNNIFCRYIFIFIFALAAIPSYSFPPLSVCDRDKSGQKVDKNFITKWRLIMSEVLAGK